MADHDRDHKAKQQNPNNKETGPGRDAGYKGKGDKPDLDNHGNQKNPTSDKYTAPKK